MGDISDDVLPESLSDEDTFEFIQLAGYAKISTGTIWYEVKFYGLWSVKKNSSGWKSMMNALQVWFILKIQMS